MPPLPSTGSGNGCLTADILPLPSASSLRQAQGKPIVEHYISRLPSTSSGNGCLTADILLPFPSTSSGNGARPPISFHCLRQAQVTVLDRRYPSIAFDKLPSASSGQALRQAQGKQVTKQGVVEPIFKSSGNIPAGRRSTGHRSAS
jgi:hypothetical protein